MTVNPPLSQECRDHDCDDRNCCYKPDCQCECHRHQQWSGAYGWVDNDWDEANQ